MSRQEEIIIEPNEPGDCVTCARCGCFITDEECNINDGLCDTCLGYHNY